MLDSDNGTGLSPCLTERSNEVTARLGRYSNLTLPESEAVKILSKSSLDIGKYGTGLQAFLDADFET